MSQKNAKAYCEYQNSRLPSIRELAQNAPSQFGVLGIVDKCEYYVSGVRFEDTKCSKVTDFSISDYSVIDTFLFSYREFVKPIDEYGNYYFNSSSNGDANHFPLGYSGQYGFVAIFPSSNQADAVRCMIR